VNATQGETDAEAGAWRLNLSSVLVGIVAARMPATIRACGRDMDEASKLNMRVRFPSPGSMFSDTYRECHRSFRKQWLFHSDKC
jgi:hypothetical protein